MKKGDLISGYEIIEDFKVIGGQSKVSFARKKGKEFFIKEFLTPKYPVDSAPGSAKMKAKIRAKCDAFEKRMRSINRRIKERCGLGGNLIFAVDFFRSGPTYYKINERIDVSGFSTYEISKLGRENKLLVCKTTCRSLSILHSEGIVHGDVKPDNILIKGTRTGHYTSKLIDFDNSFFEGRPPESIDEIVGDQVYYSPELGTYIVNEGEPGKDTLTSKSDVFALGIIYSEYLTSQRPNFPPKYNFLWEAIQDDAEIDFGSLDGKILNW